MCDIAQTSNSSFLSSGLFQWDARRDVTAIANTNTKNLVNYSSFKPTTNQHENVSHCGKWIWFHNIFFLPQLWLCAVVRQKYTMTYYFDI